MKKTFEIITVKSKEEAAAYGGEELNNLLAENKKTPVLLLLSGGSSSGFLDYVGESALGENLTVTMLDERFSQEPEINNFTQMQRLDFYALALSKDVSFIGTLPRPSETIEEFRSRMETSLRNWVKHNPSGLIFATLGMGSDGHFTGIFPNADEKEFNRLFNSENWVAARNVAGQHKYPLRVTTTMTFYKLIDRGLALICGPDKKAKLEELSENKTPPHLLPAMGINLIKNSKIFTDIVVGT